MKISKIIKNVESFLKNNIGKIALLSGGISLTSPNVVQNMIVMTTVLILLNTIKLNKKNDETNLENNIENNEVKDDEVKDDEVKNNDDKEKSDKTKNNIKLLIKKNDKNLSNPYANDKLLLKKNYKNDLKNKHFNIHVNSTICSIPIFNLRTYKELDYHFNFIIHDYDTKKINNLIMCKDIHKWMSSSSISNEDLIDELVPIYFIKKENNVTEVYEYLKLFINTNDDETKTCFVQKGIDYLVIKDNIDELIEKNLMKDLLGSKNYINYNLSVHEGVSDFLNKFLSLVLIPEDFIGEDVSIDIENYYDNKKTYEYHFNTVNSDINVFNTTL